MVNDCLDYFHSLKSSVSWKVIMELVMGGQGAFWS